MNKKRGHTYSVCCPTMEIPARRKSGAKRKTPVEVVNIIKLYVLQILYTVLVLQLNFQNYQLSVLLLSNLMSKDTVRRCVKLQIGQ